MGTNTVLGSRTGCYWCTQLSNLVCLGPAGAFCFCLLVCLFLFGLSHLLRGGTTSLRIHVASGSGYFVFPSLVFRCHSSRSVIAGYFYFHFLSCLVARFFQGCSRLSVRTRCGFLKSKTLRSVSVPNRVQYAHRHGPCPVRVTCVSVVCYRYALCGLKIYHHMTTS